MARITVTSEIQDVGEAGMTEYVLPFVHCPVT